MSAALGAVVLYLLVVVGVSSLSWAMAEKLALRTFLLVELGTVYGGAGIVAAFVRSRL